MSDSLTTAVVSIVLAIISLAALATVLSPKASTAQVLKAGSEGLSVDIATAVSPVTGGGSGMSLPSLPSVGGNGL